MKDKCSKCQNDKLMRETLVGFLVAISFTRSASSTRSTARIAWNQFHKVNEINEVSLSQV